MTKQNNKEKDKEFGIIFLNDVLKDIDKNISYKGSSYYPVFIKMDHYGYDRSFQGLYARICPTGFSTTNFLFRVQGTDFNDMMAKFLTTYQTLLDMEYISHFKPREWLYKSIKLEY